jgi:hypothetical protein
MSRNIPIIATACDEQLLLDFLRSRWSIRLARRVAPTPAEIWSDELPVYSGRTAQLFISNTEFPWSPKLLECEPEADGSRWVFVSDATTAPVIQFTRIDPERFFAGKWTWQSGGLWWGNSGAYDRSAFSRWYDAVVRWVRKNGERSGRQNDYGRYYLPDAWSRRQAQPANAEPQAAADGGRDPGS